MRKNLSFVAILCLSLFFTAISVLAQESDTENSDQPRWQVITYPVTTPLQEEYDADNNGQLEPSESKGYLQERYRLIELGNTGVDSDLLREYDANGNGTIDPREAQDIRDDISGY